MGMDGRTEARDAFASEGFEAHFVGCVAQKVVFVWDAPYECHLERGALFDDVLDLGGREDALLAKVFQLGEHLPACPCIRSLRTTRKITSKAHLLLLELHPLHDDE